MDPRLQRALDRWALADPQPLAGDAGARQYFRVLHPQLGTALVVLHPLDTPEKTDDSYFEFRALQAYLDPLLRVPTIVASDDADRCLLVEEVPRDRRARTGAGHAAGLGRVHAAAARPGPSPWAPRATPSS